MNNTKEKIVNFRSFLFIAVFVFLSIFCSLITLIISWLGILLFILLLSIAVLLMLLNKNKERYRLVTFIVCLILSIIPYLSFILICDNWSNDFTDSVVVSGMVESDVTNSGERRIFLSELKINNVRVSGKALIYVYGEDYPLESGTVITFKGKINSYKIFDGDKINGYAFRNNLRYFAVIETVENAMISDKIDAGIMINLRNAMREKLFFVMGDKTGALAYGMLTGDKAYIDSETRNYFSVSGLIHILAVSGLHLSFISAMLMFLLKRLRISRKAIALIISVFMLFYCFLASFSPSVLRAAIMSLIIIYVYLFSTRLDPLSSLCAAFSAILCVAPVFLFEVGFILSISCIYGLIIFKPIFYKLFKRLKFIDFLADKTALSISIQIGIIPVFIYFFKSFQLYAFIVNIIAIPFISVVFGLILILLPISFIIPFYLPLKICGYALNLLDISAKFVASLPYAKIILFSSTIIFLYVILYFIISRFVMLKRKRISVILSVLICFTLLLNQNPTIIKKNSLTCLDYTYSNITFMTTNEGNYLIGDFFNGSGIKNSLIDLKVRSVNGILINKLNLNIAKQLVKFNEFYSGITVYFPFNEDTVDGAIYLLNSNVKINEITASSQNQIHLFDGFYALMEKSRFYSYCYKKDNVSILFPSFSKQYNTFSRIEEFNIIRASKYYNIKNKSDIVYLISEENDYFEPLIISNRQYGQYIFNFLTGEIYNKPKEFLLF